MLKAYIDFGEKIDRSDGISSVACVIFKPPAYKQFIRPWNRILKRWKADAFHATDFYPGAQQFKRDTEARKQMFEDDSKQIPKLIGEFASRVNIVSFRPEEFLQVASPQWKDKFGTSVHSHAVQLCLIDNGWWRKGCCPHKRFAYFMESGDEDNGEVSRTVERMRADFTTNTADVIGISSFSVVDKGVARGLEAADFVAWHWNKYYMDKVRSGKEDEPRKDFAAFVHAAKDKVGYIFATGENLKYFFSLVPPEVLANGQ